MRRMFGGAIDPALLDTPESRVAVLEGLISQRLLAREAARGHMIMSREAVIDAITSAPEFQEDGKFSTAKYSAYLSSRGISDQGNVAELQSQIPLARRRGDLRDGDRPAQRRRPPRRARSAEARDRRSAHFREAVSAAGEDRRGAGQGALRRQPGGLPHARASARGIRRALGRGAFAPGPADRGEIKASYDSRANQFRVEEQRRASHILVKTKDEAEKILQEAKKAPARFAELAKKHSQDPGSAEKGGDLGWFGRGMMVKPFEEAAFKLGQNEMQVVESEFGYHVIRLTGVQPGKTRPYEEVKKELTDELARVKGQRRFAEAAETFSNLVYEQSDTLKPAAERFKLPVQQTGWISKSARQELGALDNPKLLAALFTSDAIKNRRNTDAIEVAPSTLVAARITDHQPAAQRSFEEMKGEIAEQLRQREASALALKEGTAKLEQLRKGQDAGLKWSAPRVVSRREAQGLSGNMLRQVMSADTAKLPVYIGVPLPDAGYALIRISKVIDEPVKEGDPQVARAAQLFGGAQYEAYIASLRAQADVEINQKNLEAK